MKLRGLLVILMCVLIGTPSYSQRWKAKMVPFAKGENFEYYCSETSGTTAFVARKGMFEEFWRHKAFSLIWSKTPVTASMETRPMVGKLSDKIKELLYPHRHEIGTFTYYYQMDWDGRVRETYFWIDDVSKLPNVKKYIRLFEEIDTFVLENIKFDIVPNSRGEENPAMVTEYREKYDRMDLKGWGHIWEDSRWLE